MLVSCALMSLIGIFILQLYMSAQTEFEHTTGTISMSQHARKITSKLLPLLASAVPTDLDTNGILTPPSGRTFYECDFLCSRYVVRDPAPEDNNAWNGSSRMWLDETFGRWITEYDTTNVSAELQREPSIYRYRVLYRPYEDTVYTAVPRRAVVFQRLKTSLIGDGQTNAPLAPGGGANPNKQQIDGTTSTIIANKVSLLQFARDGENLQLRIRIYNVDPQVWNDAISSNSTRMRNEAALDSSFMRGLNRQVRFRAYDVTTSVHLPASTI
jgi:hypothetical protein